MGEESNPLEHSVSSACPDLTKQHSTPCQPIVSIYRKAIIIKTIKTQPQNPLRSSAQALQDLRPL